MGLQRQSPSSEDLAKALAAIIEEEYRIWLRRRRFEPLSASRAEAIIRSAIGNTGANLVLQRLLDEGFLYCIEHTRSGCRLLQSFVAFQAQRFTDLRKYTGYCSVDEPSRMRTLGFDARLCKLDLPDFTAVDARSLAKRLRSLPGGASERAAKIVEAWWPSYSREQAEIIEKILGGLNKPGAMIYTIDMPTGSGKTEAFMTPAIANAADDGLSIIVYPRKALATDQLRRLAALYIRLLEKGLDKLPLLDVYDGESCYMVSPPPGSKAGRCAGRPERLPEVTLGGEKCLVSYIDNGAGVEARCSGKTYKLSLTDARLENLAMKERLPRLLITNYDMFHRILSNLQTIDLHRSYLARLRPRRVVLVFDEAHEFQGVDFMHMLLLTARFLLLLRKLRLDTHVSIVYSSATLPIGFDKMIQTLIKSLGFNVSLNNLPTASGGGAERTILVTAVLPDPETSGQWLNQLGIFTLTSFSQARIERKLKPFKTISFVDSLRYLREIYRRTGQTLLADAEPVLKDHTPLIHGCGTGTKPGDDPLCWDPAFFNDKNVVDNVARILKNNRYFNPANPSTGVLAEHHAGLSIAARQLIENSFKRADHPITIVATSTLEMGVDMPNVANILQFRKPRSEASMMQRIGRAARSLDTLRAGLASIFLTSMPSDALLVLDKEMMDRYLYKCKNIKAPAPRVNAPANKNILLAHMLYTALSKDNNLARDFDRPHQGRGDPRDRIKGIIGRLKALIKSDDDLTRLAAATIEAYRSAGIPGLDAKPEDLINELLDDLSNVEKKLEEGTVSQKIDELASKVDELIGYIRSQDTVIGKAIDDSNTIMSSSSRWLLGQRPEVLILPEECEVDLTRCSREVFKVIKLLRSLEGTLLEIRNLVTQARTNNKEPKNLDVEIRKTINDAKGIISSLKDSPEQVLTSLLGRNYSRFISDLDKVSRLLDDIEQMVDDLGKLRRRMKYLLTDRPSRVLSELSGKPYFSSLLRSAPVQVRIRSDCRDTGKCGSERSDDPFSALLRTIPLSEAGDGSEAGFFFLPPGAGKLYDVEAYAIAYNPRKKDYFITPVDLDKIVEDLLSYQFGGTVASGYRNSGKPGSRFAFVRLGENVDEARIYVYSSLAEILAQSLVYDAGSDKRNVSNALYVVFRLRPKSSNVEDLTVVIQVGRISGNKVVTMSPGESITVGYCRHANVLFIGIDIDGARPSPTARIPCPLAEIQKQLYGQAVSGARKLWDALKRLGEACDYLPANKSGCQHRGARGMITVTDVLTYMLRANPLLRLAVRGSREVREVSAGRRARLVSLDVEESRVVSRYSALRLNVSSDSLLYPLPVSIEASLLRTYTAAIDVDAGTLKSEVSKFLGLLGSASTPPAALKWLLVKIMLSAAGYMSSREWDSTADSLMKSIGRGDVDGVADILERLAQRTLVVLQRLLSGEQYVLSLSGVRRGATLLFDLAVEQPNSVGLLYEAFKKLIRRNRGLVESIVALMTELTLAHSVYYATATLHGYDDVVKLHRARRRGGYSYVMIEAREGGVGFLPTLTDKALVNGLVKTMASASNAMAAIRASRQRAMSSISQRGSASKYMGLLEWIATRVAEAYGAVVPARRGGVNVAFTFIPSWLARVVLTPEKLRSYAKLYEQATGAKVDIDDREWSNVAAEVLPAVFDADFPDAPSMHLGGVDSWLGDYEKRLLQSSLLLHMFYAILR